MLVTDVMSLGLLFVFDFCPHMLGFTFTFSRHVFGIAVDALYTSRTTNYNHLPSINTFFSKSHKTDCANESRLES